MINMRNYSEPKEASYPQKKALGPIPYSRTGELCPVTDHLISNASVYSDTDGAGFGDNKLKLGLLFLC